MTPTSDEDDRTNTATSSQLTDSNVGGFYIWPPSWIVERPQQPNTGPISDTLTREVFSFEFDCGIKLKASAQGYFVFDFAECTHASMAGRVTADWKDRLFFRMRFMNLYLVCIYTALTRLEKVNVEKHHVDRTAYFAARSFDLNPYNASCDERQHHKLEQDNQRQSHLPHFLTVYSENVLTAASAQTNKTFNESGNDSVVISDILLQAFKLDEDDHFETSHIVAWTITERCLNQLWSTYIEGRNDAFSANLSRRFINSERKNTLNGRDFSASVVSEILSLAGVIDFDTYRALNRVRRDRNAWLHQMKLIDRVKSVASLNLATTMLRASGLIDVEFYIMPIQSVLLSLGQTANAEEV